MKALILNSGLGSRMGVLTSEHPKCMTEISSKETILSRQLRQIADAGIEEVVMTTGYYDGVLVNYCNSLDLPLHFTFVNNPVYDRTNYIYSIYCAREYLDDDIILMHGDLVFENEVFDKLMESAVSCMTVSSILPLPEKDFKAQVKDGMVMKVGVDIFNDAMEAQALYITGNSFIPETVLMDPDTLKTLPEYQKKATMMDALCHAIEAFWSVNSTDESKEYSRTAIKSIIENMDAYLDNTEDARKNMLMASNTAGKAINITQTTAGHAMCYKITSMFGCAHGHAAILCDRILFPWMIRNTDKCIDSRGEDYLKKTLDEIGLAMGCENAEAGAEKLVQIFEKLGLDIPVATERQYEELKTSVNPVRLKNHPIALDFETIDKLYHEVLR